jgi:hypothetical protein
MLRHVDTWTASRPSASSAVLSLYQVDLCLSRPLGRSRRRWEDNIKMDLHEVGCVGTDWIDLAQDKDSCRALVNAVTNLRVP